MTRREPFLGLTAIGLIISLTACAQTYPLPTVASHNGWCAELGYDGVLRGDAYDPRVAWGEMETRTNQVIVRKDLVWPPGYTARFTPEIEILDASRQVRFVAGDAIEGGCVGPLGTLYVAKE